MNKDEGCICSTRTNPGSQPRNIEGNPKTKGKIQPKLSNSHVPIRKLGDLRMLGVNFCFLGLVKVHSIEYKRSIGEEAPFRENTLESKTVNAQPLAALLLSQKRWD